MGVTQGGKYLHSVSKLTLVELASICNGIAREFDITPRVVVDCNNLVFVYSNYMSPTDAVAKHLARFAAPGIIMVPVCDGATRPISKQATNDRIAKKELCRITALCLRNQICSLRNRITNENNTDKESLSNQLVALSKKLKANETQATQSIPRNFVQELDHELRQIHAYSVDGESAGGYVEEVVVSEFQADAYMAGQLINRTAVMAMTRDSDIPIVAGDCCICIKTFTKGNYEIVSTSKNTLRQAMRFIDKNSTNAKFTEAAVPLFDGVSNPRLRALLMLMLGCDVYGKGMKGVGGKKLMKMMTQHEKKSSNDTIFSFLQGEFMAENKLSEEAVNTYIDAIIYEPTNAAPESITTTNPPRTYLFGVPDRLPKYLEQYSVDDTFRSASLFEGPEMSTCKGVGGRNHAFLLHEGSGVCTECSTVVCRSCQGIVDKCVFCLECYTARAIAPLPKNGTMTIAEMRLELKEKYNFDGASELDIIEGEDVFVSIGYIDRYRQQGSNVPFPLYPTSALQDHCSRQWNDVIDIDFKSKGAFLAHPNVTARHIPGILKLFGSIVAFDQTKKTSSSSEMMLLHDILPSTFFMYAGNSRVDSGYRLLRRCIRHATDSRFPKIDKEIARENC